MTAFSAKLGNGYRHHAFMRGEKCLAVPPGENYGEMVDKNIAQLSGVASN